MALRSASSLATRSTWSPAIKQVCTPSSRTRRQRRGDAIRTRRLGREVTSRGSSAAKIPPTQPRVLAKYLDLVGESRVPPRTAAHPASVVSGCPRPGLMPAGYCWVSLGRGRSVSGRRRL
jgi:hypothetical protein